MKAKHDDRKKGKRAYEKPVLTRHGKLAAVTASMSPPPT
jgi:hypothetical protein